MSRSEHALRVCVYCGSRPGRDPAYVEAARQLGRAIAGLGCELVYGGGRVGLMGELAESAMAAGARVTGIIPESLLRREVGHHGLSELLVVPDMHTRKRLMAERADAFIALPGGLGTFEELFEVWTWRHLGYHMQPIGLLDIGGYYRHMSAFLQHALAEGFVGDDQMSMLRVGADPQQLLGELLAEITRRREAPADYSRI